MHLFKKYALPSVQNQTFKTFDWWFLVNPNFPGLTKNHIAELEKYGRICNIESYWNEAQPEVGDRLKLWYKNEWMCSTRLDSDDMLHADFMAHLNRTVGEREEFVTLKYGYVISGDKAAKREYTVNPFLSYVEYANPFKSVFHVDHCRANKSKIPFRADPLVGWAQVCHGDNIKNVAELKVKNFHEICFDASQLKGFPIEKP